MCIERLAFCEALRKLIGAAPYIWAGNVPQVGADCSGLICHCLRVSGLDPHLPDMSCQMLVDNYESQLVPEFKPGVLCFYGRNKNKITHIMAVLSMWGPNMAVLAGMMKGDRTCTTAEISYAKRAMCGVTTGDYRKSSLVCMVDPFLNPNG